MKSRSVYLIFWVLLLCIGTVSAAASSYGQKPPKPEYDIQKILSLTTITTEVRERLLENAGLGMNRMLWDSGKWEEKAQLDETPFRILEPDEVLSLEMIKIYGTQAVVSREIAIDKLREENKDGKNDRKISENYMNLAQTYEAISRTAPDYNFWRLEMLQEATTSDKSNINAWNQRITALEQAGMNQEAAEVKHQRDLAKGSEGGSGFMDFLLLISPVISVLGILLAIVGIGAARKRKSQIL
jgi:hypothetical protein